MDRQELIGILSQAKSSGTIGSANQDQLSNNLFLLQGDRQWVVVTPKVRQHIVEAITALPELNSVLHSWTHIGTDNWHQTPETVTDRLLVFLATVDAHDLVDSLYELCSMNRGQGYQVVLLAGLRIEKRLRLTDDIDLVPLDDLVPTPSEKRIRIPLENKGPGYGACCALVYKFPRDPFLNPIFDSLDERIRYPANERSRRLDDVRRCLTIVGPSSPRPCLQSD